jgi:hypothetical protein
MPDDGNDDTERAAMPPIMQDDGPPMIPVMHDDPTRPSPPTAFRSKTPPFPPVAHPGVRLARRPTPLEDAMAKQERDEETAREARRREADAVLEEHFRKRP